MNFLPFVFAFFLTAFLTISAVKFFPRFGLLDNPKKYGLKRAPIPYFGGLVIFVGFLVSVLIFLPLSKEILGLLAGVILIVMVSFLDDAFELPSFVRLGFQILAAFLLVLGGVGIAHLTNPFGGIFDLTSFDWNIGSWWGGEYHLTLLADLFTVAWVLLLTNSLNWFDGVPGITSGIAALAALALFFLAAREGFHFFDQSVVVALSGILAGCAISFTFFNFPPPKILLGDTGSMFFGFVLAALAIFSGGKIATAALVLGVPLIDAVWVIFRRLKQKQSPFRGDFGHLHHRLVAAGFSDKRTVLTIYLTSAIFGAIALFVDTSFGKLIAFGGLFMMMLGVEWKLRNSLNAKAQKHLLGDIQKN